MSYFYSFEATNLYGLFSENRIPTPGSFECPGIPAIIPFFAILTSPQGGLFLPTSI